MIGLFLEWVQNVYETLHGTSGVLQVFDDYGGMFQSLLEQQMFQSLIMVMQTLGITLCAVYLLLEMADTMSDHVITTDQFFLLLLRFIIAYLLITNCITLLNGFMELGAAIGRELDDRSVATYLFTIEENTEKIKDELEGIDGTEAVGYLFKLIIPYLICLVSNIIVYFIALSRAVELTIRTVFAPFAVANIYHDMQRSAGFKYLKKILALSLQLAVCIGISFSVSLVLQSLSGDPTAMVDASTHLLTDKFEIHKFLDDYVLGGSSYPILLGILCAKVGLLIKSMQICNDIVGV